MPKTTLLSRDSLVNRAFGSLRTCMSIKPQPQERFTHILMGWLHHYEVANKYIATCVKGCVVMKTALKPAKFVMGNSL